MLWLDMQQITVEANLPNLIPLSFYSCDNGKLFICIGKAKRRGGYFKINYKTL